MLGRNVLLGMAVGAMAAFVADPQSGRRRRARARDRFSSARLKTRQALDATVRDLSDRAAGVKAAMRTVWTGEDVDDRRLLGRVHKALGRACSHPRAIEVDVTDGIVILRGPVLASELDDVVTRVSRVRGVTEVVGDLEMYESIEDVPAMQGSGRGFEMLRPNWAPPPRTLMTAAGLAATGLCVARYARR